VTRRRRRAGNSSNERRCSPRDEGRSIALLLRSRSKTSRMPLVDVTFDDTVGEAHLLRLGKILPDVVAEAVDCPEEPWVGPLHDGDLEIRFRGKEAYDVGGLNVVVEVRTKLFESRLVDTQRRAELILEHLSSLGLGKVGVWLMLVDGAWSQAV
jgi:hypothetical protein